MAGNAASRMVKKAFGSPTFLFPTYQIAYGIECEVDVCPYAEDAMTLMDYRTNYVTSARAEVRREGRS